MKEGDCMTSRIEMIRILEKMERHPQASKAMHVKDTSEFKKDGEKENETRINKSTKYVSKK
jgi:hypothetical protein